MVDFQEVDEDSVVERLVKDYSGLLEELKNHVAPASRDDVSRILGGLELFYRALYSGTNSYNSLHEVRADFIQ